MTTNNTPRYPDITVELIGRDGNAFAILGAVRTALSRAGVPKHISDEYLSEATSGDYHELIAVTQRWVNLS